MVPGNRSRLSCEGEFSWHVQNPLLEAAWKERSVEARIERLRNGHPDEQPSLGLGPGDARPDRGEMSLKRLSENLSLRPVELAQLGHMTIVVAAGKCPFQQLLVEVRRAEIVISFQFQDRIKQSPGQDPVANLDSGTEGFAERAGKNHRL